MLLLLLMLGIAPASLFLSGTVRAQATYTVNSTGDSGDANAGDGSCDTGLTISGGAAECTFRAAIEEANADSLKDNIFFDIPILGAQSISPGTPLPAVTQPVVIDATTQDGYSGLPLVELEGSNTVVAPGAFDDGLVILGGDSTIRGLAINRFDQSGLYIKTGDGNLVQSNIFGLDRTGTIKMANLADGISITDSSDNVIGGSSPEHRNIMSGNGQGIAIANVTSTNNRIIGNFIGTAANGLDAIGNEFSGILITAEFGQTEYPSETIIGGANPGEGNVISGNGGEGIVLFRSPRNQIRGNHIGVDASGDAALSNATDGIQIIQAADNQIGSEQSAGGNIISGNGGVGVSIVGELATGNVLEGNFIGTDKNASSPIPNGSTGVLLTSEEEGLPSSGTTVGSTQPGFGNVISGNLGDGVRIEEGSSGNQVMGNIIGLDKFGDNPVGNTKRGVAIVDSDLNVIGGVEAGAGNHIAANGEEGVLVTKGSLAHPPAGTQILGNVIGLSILDESLGNAKDGIFLNDTKSTIVGSELSGNTISGNFGNGIHIRNEVVGVQRVEGNFVGVDSGAEGARPNRLHGILIREGGGHFIGSDSGKGNIIAGNAGHGILLDGSPDNIPGIPDITLVDIYNNHIGTNRAGDPLGNGGYGIRVNHASFNNIGNIDRGNEIAFNGSAMGPSGHGVVIDGGDNNLISRNSIHDNAGRGIDLVDPLFPRGSPYAFNIPDTVDRDDGSNQLLNMPLVTHVSFDALGLEKTVEWTIYGTPFDTYELEIYSNEEADTSGFGEAQEFIKSVEVTTDQYGRGTYADTFQLESVNGELVGPLLSALTIHAGNTSEISMIDTDGDAIADKWEELGVDINEDGVRDYPVSDNDLPISDPLHKDIFVEIDAMECTIRLLRIDPVCFAPKEADLLRVEWAFEFAPGALVGNPDGEDGISLHLELDETEIPHHDWVGEDETDQYGWEFFYKVKRNGSLLVPGGFGTPVERVLPRTLDAKRLFYRYAIFADHFGEFDYDKGRQVPTSTGGIAETTDGTNGLITDAFVDGANDFTVTLGLWTNPGGTPDQKVGTLMHELGHTLAIMHGGVDHIHHKPNYYSVMNYLWTVPMDWPNWVLDYSRQELNTMDEKNIDEITGIGGEPSLMVPVGPPVYAADLSVKHHGKLWSQGGSHDFDRDGIKEPFGPPTEQADLNNFGFVKFHDYNNDKKITYEDQWPDEVLIGHEDWSGLRFNFLGTPSSDDSQAPSPPPVPEMDLEHKQHLDSIGEKEGQLSFTVNHVLVDESAGLVTLTVHRSGGTLGIVSVDYRTFDVSALAGSDYSETFGMLDFDEGQVFASFDVPILDDGDSEDTEVFEVRLSNPQAGATLGLDTLYVGIEPNDGPGILQFDNPFFEANEDDDTATITVVRTGGTVGAVSVDYATMEDVAIEGLDFQSTSGTLNFADGETSQSFTVPVFADTQIEGNEGFVLSLSNPTGGAGLGKTDQAVLTILNIPWVAATIEFASVLYEPGETDGTLLVELVRSEVTDTAVSVELGFNDITATESEDHQATLVTVNFDVEEVSQVIGIPILDDNLAEGIESFELRLSNPSANASLGLNYRSLVRIIDDETFYVTNTLDDGLGSLRKAMENANAHANDSVINFRIDQPGLNAIHLLDDLPTITAPLIIDGYSQLGAQANTSRSEPDGVLLIEVDWSDIVLSRGLRIDSSDVTVRGLVMSQFNIQAINVLSANNNIALQGNYIGVDSTGTTAMESGDIILSSSDSLIGGADPADMNIIGGNSEIVVGGTNNRVVGNRVGVGTDGGNIGSTSYAEYSVTGIKASGSDIIVGGDLEGEANLVRFYHHGVEVTGKRVTVRKNVIFDNRRFDLVLRGPDVLPGFGFNMNDPLDSDVGGNDLQNHPVLSLVEISGGQIRITGRLESMPLGDYLLDFYANTEAHATGYGGGEEWLGSASVQTDQQGTAAIDVSFDFILPPGTWVSATATDANGNTSAFSLSQPLGEILTETLTVNTEEDVDDGNCSPAHCSLREALRGANNYPGPNQVHFDIPGDGEFTIDLSRPLPTITESVVVDGYTQHGTQVNNLDIGTNARLRVAIDKTLTWEVFDNNTPLVVFGNQSVLRGLGIAVKTEIQGVGHRIEGCFFGTDLSGTTWPGRPSGISVRGEVARFDSSQVMIGGPGAETRNLFVGDNLIQSDESLIQGNLFGSDASGTRHILWEGGGSPPGGLSVGGSNNLIGGSGAGEGNVLVWGSMGVGGTSNTVKGNLIGLGADGMPPLDRDGLIYPRTENGLGVGGSGHLIGGTAPGEGNVISWNGEHGIEISSTATDIRIKGNLIGTDPSGTIPLGNGQYHGHGIEAGGEVLIGGPEPGAGNLIAYNYKSGICVRGGPAEIEGNIIRDNLELGIDLDTNEYRGGPDCNHFFGIISPNDEGDVDTGGNQGQNFPVLTSLSHDTGLTTVEGTLSSMANQTYRLEFFANYIADPTGHGEGEEIIGTAEVVTDGDGEAAFSLDFNYALAPGSAVVATATDVDGNTSEFSAFILEGNNAALSDLEVTASIDVEPVREDQESSFTATVTNNGPDVATGVRLEVDAIGFRFIRSVPPEPCLGGQDKALCDLGALTTAESVDIQLVFDPMMTGLLSYEISVRASQGDPDTRNNSSPLVTYISPPATTDLYTLITDTPDPVDPGEALVYRVEVGNLGDFDASDIDLQVQIAGHSAVTDIQPGDHCSESAGLVECSIDTLASGQSTHIDITVEAGLPGVFMTASAEAVAAVPADPDLTNNTTDEWSYVAENCVTSIFASAHKGSDGMSTLYSIDPVSGDTTLIGSIGYERVGAMDFEPSTGILYAAGERADGSDTQVLLEINPNTGEGNEIGPLGFTPVTDFAFREATGELYAFGGESELYLVSIDTGTATLINQVTEFLNGGNGLVFSRDGRLYQSNLLLWELDPDTGVVLAESPMSFTPNLSFERFSGLDFDARSGKYYGIIKEGRPPPNAWFGYLNIPGSEGVFLHQTADGMDGMAISCNPAPNIMFRDGFESTEQTPEVE